MDSVWLGLHQLHKFHNNPLHPVAMARRRKRQFKQLALVKSENVGHTGGQIVLAELEKQQDQMVAAYVDKVRISFHINSSDDLAGANRPAFFGGQFYLSTSNTGLSSSTVIGSTGFRGFGGTCTLDVKRLIRDNTVDADSGFSKLYIWVETTDLNLQAGDLTMVATMEAWGRWHAINAA